MKNKSERKITFATDTLDYQKYLDALDRTGTAANAPTPYSVEADYMTLDDLKALIDRVGDVTITNILT